jgi:formate hydrogenlyase subunit 3/multisubunit Na+/H+ antiporter MnhD subunit
MIFLYASIILFVFAGLAQLVFKGNFKARIVTFFSGIATILGLIPTTIALFQNQTLSSTINFNGLIGNVSFILDPLSALFVLIILIIGFLSAIYSNKYLEPYKKDLSTHYFFFGIFIPAMLLVVIVQNILMFLICWEIMSLSSFFLLLFESEKKEVRQSAINYLITMQIGALFLFCGFILLNLKTGSLNFADFQGQISNTIFILFMIGFGIKAGFVPLHTWLPKAHPIAPSHISALMSGVMIKTGIYGILRILTYIETPSLLISYLILFIGVLSAFFGILYAVAQRNYKKMLAYSSIENIGLITISLGVAMLGLCYKNNVMTEFGFLGVFAHILNHSVFKSLLFLAAGSIDSKVHTKDCEKLGGLIKSMPYTASLFLIGSVSICAMPPFNGFISEIFIYLGMLHGLASRNHFLYPVLMLSMGILAFVGAMALISFANMFSTIFLGEARTEKTQAVNEDSTISMLIPMGLLALFALSIGIFPTLFMPLFLSPCSLFLKTQLIFPSQLLANIIIFNLILLALTSILLIIRIVLLKNKTVVKHKTWSCGYQNPNTKMQYSNYSFSRPFLGFLTPLFIRELDFKQIKELFPQKTYFKSKTIDIFEFYIIKPIVEFDKFVISKFYWIQGGNIQKYLLYGLIFLLITIVMVVKL